MLSVFAQSADEQAEVENTTTEGSMAGVVFPANFWLPGKIIRFRSDAIVKDSNSTDTVTPRLRFGVSSTPGSNDALGAAAAVDAADSDIGLVVAELQCRDVGDGTYQLIARGEITTIDAAPARTLIHAISTPFNPAVATYLDYTATWSVAHVDNEIAARGYVCEEMVA